MAPRTNEQFEQIRAESKTKILVAALELFAIDGYHNTSISKIAKHAGISKGLMYNYFASKEQLLKEVVILSLEDAKKMSEQLLQNLEEISPTEALRLSLELFFQMLIENKTLWKLTFSLAMQISNMPSVTAVISKMFEDILQQFEMVLQLNGYSDYNIEAKLLAAHLDGIALHFLIFEKTYPLEEVKNKLIANYCK
ncbi:MAG TPA: TetR/AcrR family transcriptional regulator [Flavobacteriia bacterium]|nr:TetR/AcrR family transcriptional regulator [Flavobacteriia bacterium]